MFDVLTISGKVKEVSLTSICIEGPRTLLHFYDSDASAKGHAVRFGPLLGKMVTVTLKVSFEEGGN